MRGVVVAGYTAIVVRLLGDNAAVVSYVRITQRDGQVSTAQETRVWHRAAPSAPWQHVHFHRSSL